MDKAHPFRTSLCKRESQSLDEFIEVVEEVLTIFGAEIVLDRGDTRVYEIPMKGGVLVQYGDPLPDEINFNASVDFLGVQAKTVVDICSMFRSRGYGFNLKDIREIY